MACEICNRNNCSRSFHSIAEQEEYEEVHEHCIAKIERLEAKIEELEREAENGTV